MIASQQRTLYHLAPWGEIVGRNSRLRRERREAKRDAGPIAAGPSPEEPSGQFTASFYVVAHLDIMGYGSALMELQAKGPETTFPSDSLARVIRIRRDLIGLSAEFVDKLETRTDRGLRDPIPQEIRSKLLKSKFTSVSYSDTLVLYHSLGGGRGDLSMATLTALLTNCCSMMLVQLGKGDEDIDDTLPLRGGIDVDFGAEVADRASRSNPHPLPQLYSAAQVEAYRLEKDVAIYPRVVVSNGMMTMLNQYIADRELDLEARLNAKLGRRAKSLLFKDFDDNYCLDFIGSGIRSLQYPGDQLDQVTTSIKKALAYVTKAFDKWNGHERLGPKYRYLLEYMRSRLPLWGLANQ